MAKYTEKILSDTLLLLIKRKPLDDISVKDLTNEASMNRKTFYAHFHGIDDLLKWTLNKNYSLIQIKPVSLNSWKDQARRILEFIKENRYFFKAMFYSRYYAELHLYLKNYLTNILKEYESDAWITYEKDGKDVLDARKRNFIIKFYSGAIHTLIEEWFLTGMKESVDDMINTLSRLMRNSIYHSYDSFAELN